MSKHKYYYYDHASCTFVEARPGRKKLVKRIAGVLVLTALLAGTLTLVLDRLLHTPEELALLAENEMLQAQIVQTRQRIHTFSEELDRLARSDQTLYRTILEADPIPEDVRQAGVGGADAYESFDGYRASTASLLRETSQQLDELERKINLQNASFRELSELAAENSVRMAEMPAILPANGRLSSGYGKRMHPILRVRKMHHGLDFAVNTGTPIVAPGDGVVKNVGRGPGYGKYIILSHPTAGYQTLYAHLSKIEVSRGQQVKRGEQIGLSGNTGRSTGPHLHYEVRDAKGRTLNPVYFFAPGMTPKEYRRLLEAAENSTVSLD